MQFRMSTLIFQPEQRTEGRPAGITLIATIMFGYSLAAFVYAALIQWGAVALSSGAWIIGGGMEVMGAGIFLVYALVHAAVATGLWRMHRWALRACSLLVLYGLVQVTPAISSAVGDGRIPAIAREGLQILWRSAALWYLWRESTREAFRRRTKTPS